MSPNLAALHDIEATAIAPPDSWIIDTIALSENPPPRSYPTSVNIIARLNHGYGSTGTLPNSNQYNEFAQRVATYVRESTGCTRWQIGNETNLSREWPNSAPIYPWHYAACFELCRDAIHAQPGHAQDEVLIAASGPWNDECKYEGNPTGDWITYFADVLSLLEGGFDGYSLHAYTHGYNVNLVTDTSRMNAPFQNRYYNFLTYRDYCDAIPPQYAHLPAYITEANGNGPWQAVGLMPAMLGEIDFWNRSNNAPLIQCVAFYRYPRYDDFYIEGRGDVIAEYNAAVQRGYMSPAISAPIPEPPDPQPPTPEPPTPEPIEWDPRLTMRGCELTVAEAAEGQTVWRCIAGEWFNQEQAQGRVNTFVTLLDENGQLAVGVPITWYWSTGDDTKPSEIKNDPWLGHPYSKDFAMYNVAPSYGVRIADGNPTDVIWGMGLGSVEQPDYTIHTAYSFTFQRRKSATPPPIPPLPAHTQYVIAPAGAYLRAEPVTGAVMVAVPYGEAVTVDGSEMGSDGYQWHSAIYEWHKGWIRADLLSVQAPEPPEPPVPGSGHLIWPVQGALVTQRFGDHYEYYQEHFEALGHNGIDFALPAGSPIYATADGIVTMAHEDKLGYGFFVRLFHPALRLGSLYAHCSELLVSEGDRVTQGQQIATVGSTGNSTGPHCHWELCAQDASGYTDVSHGHSKGRSNPEIIMWLIGMPPVYQ